MEFEEEGVEGAGVHWLVSVVDGVLAEGGHALCAVDVVGSAIKEDGVAIKGDAGDAKWVVVEFLGGEFGVVCIEKGDGGCGQSAVDGLEDIGGVAGEKEVDAEGLGVLKAIGSAGECEGDFVAIADESVVLEGAQDTAAGDGGCAGEEDDVNKARDDCVQALEFLDEGEGGARAHGYVLAFEHVGIEGIGALGFEDVVSVGHVEEGASGEGEGEAFGEGYAFGHGVFLLSTRGGEVRRVLR